MKSFVEAHAANGKRIVCVTSGGTTVPLEAKTVRFIDNFSTGNRGAACTERFLASGYAVIFLHRAGSAFPYIRHVEAKRAPADLVTRLAEARSMSEALTCVEEDAKLLRRLTAGLDLRGDLLTVPFTTIFEYLFLLRAASRALQPANSRAMLFLAAAVSDFYIPEATMARDKIQSHQEGLSLNLSNVPKMLGRVKERTRITGGAEEEGRFVGGWAPQAFLVSFKLETNQNILEAKAAGALLNYGVDVVVSNLLGRHTHEVNIISRQGEGGEGGGYRDIRVLSGVGGIRGDEETPVEVEGIRSMTVVRQDGSTLETPLVEAMIEAHRTFIQES